MKPLLIAACVAALAPLGTPAFAGGLTAEAVNAASPEAAAKDDRARLAKAQVLLDRARFSPGVIDGRDGDNFRGALAVFEAANGLKADGKLDAAAFAKLTEDTSAPAIAPYTIRAEDVKGPFTPEIPDKMEKQAELPRLGYRNPVELIAERFHMDADLLLELNPDKTFDKAGEAIVVANVRADERRDDRKGKAAKIEVLKGDRRVRALAEDGTLLATYPASIGSDEKPAPSGTLKVVGVARNPDYTYDPEYKFKGVKAKEKFTLKPGPNNPVGTVWIDLSEDSYGIHGTPEPDKVGKTASHGCVRLTNWDAEDLAFMVRNGIPVSFRE